MSFNTITSYVCLNNCHGLWRTIEYDIVQATLLISQLFLVTKQLLIIFTFLKITVKFTLPDNVVQIVWYCVHICKEI